MTVSQKNPKPSVLSVEPQRPENTQQVPDQTTPVLAVFGRFTWMLLGPFVLVLACLGLFSSNQAFFTHKDIIYWAALGAMLLGRWVEFRTGHALTGTGEPATVAHLRQYLLSATTVGLIVWVGVKLVQQFWLTS